MCGLVGALLSATSRSRLSSSLLEAMRDTMVHRGPDGAGVWLSPDGSVGLGHRRLAIIDLSESAHQPMSNKDESVWVVFNGEIYNHAEIRADLQKAGQHDWQTDHSDTEVIVHAFRQWGIDCIHRFHGMFAMAIWDEFRKELWLVRDRIGIKPLYYSIHHGRLTFASEIKALLADPEQPRAVNEEALFHYLSFLTTPAPQTLFDGIKKLPPGTWLRVRSNLQIHEHKYWDPLDNVVPQTHISEQDICENILSQLRTSVNLRSVSDVPVGVFLSGGIDSSTNAALFAESQSAPVRTYSIGYDSDYGTYRNEFHFARRMAAEIRADSYEQRLQVDDLIEFLPRMVRLQDEPIADPVCFPVYYVSKLARDNGTIVCQVGEGADELFWGYPSWRRALQLQHMDNLPFPRALKTLGVYAAQAIGKDRSLYYEYLRRGSQGQPIFWGGAEAFTDTDKRRLLSARLRRVFRDTSSWDVIEPIYSRFQEKAWEPSPLNWMSYLDLNLRLPELLLMRVDKMAMGASVEARVPFLDHALVELAMGIPQSMKTKHGVLKRMLKRAVRGVIPDELIDRPKQGFGVPVYEWFMGKLGDTAREELTGFCQETDYLDATAVRKLFDQNRSADIWYLLNFALWWKHHIAQEDSTVLKRCA